MKILQYCPAYRPNVGGLEFVAHTLGKEFVSLGHNSRVLTPQIGTWPDDQDLGVVRSPGLSEQWAALRWADAVICHQDALGLIWPILLTRKPRLLMFHVTPQGKRRWPGSFVMRRIARQCDLYAPSQFIARQVTDVFSRSCNILPNPYDSACFYPPEKGVQRDVDFVFVGRFAMVKAVDVFVEALGQLSLEGLRPSVEMIGDGEERAGVEAVINKYNMGSHVKLRGEQNGAEIADTLRRARCLVVPSRYEPYGIVALEGRACGCELLVNVESGGLPEAAGPHARPINGVSLPAVVKALKQFLQVEERSDLAKRPVNFHGSDLEKHKPANVALAYLAALDAIA